MPQDIVDIDLTTSTGSPEKPTYNDVLIVGRSDTAPSGASFNQPEPFADPANVATDFGEGSDVHVASEAVDAMGVDDWHVVVMEESSTTEVLGDSASASVSSGTVSTQPLAGNFLPEITVDGGDPVTVTPVTDTPPDANTTVESGEALVNMDTGEIVVGDSSEGTGPGIEVTYHSLSWTETFTNSEAISPDIAFLADIRAGREHIGDLDELVAWGSGEEVAVVGAYRNGGTYTDDTTAMDAYHEIGGYVSSGTLLPVGHKSSEAVSGYVAGQLATHEAWFDPMYDGDGLPISTGLFRKSLVGNPNQAETFEGGDADGAGPVNILIRKQGVLVLSNSLTTAGQGSNYRYIDIRRTEGYLATEAERALVSLRLREDKIGFDRDGRTKIEDALRGVLVDERGGSGPLTSFSLDVPKRTELSEAMRAGRVWGPITIEAVLDQNVHRFEIDLAAQV